MTIRIPSIQNKGVDWFIETITGGNVYYGGILKYV
jgi:hypothetical protein